MNSRRLNDDAVGVEFVPDLLQRVLDTADHGATPDCQLWQAHTSSQASVQDFGDARNVALLGEERVNCHVSFQRRIGTHPRHLRTRS